MKPQIALCAALGVFASMTAGAITYDGQVSIADEPGLGTTSGGAFRVTINDRNGPGLDAVPNSFLTFCIELDETIVYGPNYNVKVSGQADKGGNNTDSGDPISASTAWLFKKFTEGTLVGTGGFTLTDAGGNALQNAIWFLEEEIADAAPGASYKALVDAALAANGIAAGDYAAARAQNQGGAYEYLVRALNVYSGGSYPDGTPTAFNQDLLVVVPEPTTYIAGGLALLPLLIGLRSRWVRK
jgi:hypothetical protein